MHLANVSPPPPPPSRSREAENNIELTQCALPTTYDRTESLPQVSLVYG